MQFHPLPNLWPSLMWAPRLSPTTGLYVTSASECQFFLLREDHENCQNFVYVFYSNQFLIDYSSLEFYPVKHSCYIHRYSLVLKKKFVFAAPNCKYMYNCEEPGNNMGVKPNFYDFDMSSCSRHVFEKSLLIASW